MNAMALGPTWMALKVGPLASSVPKRYRWQPNYPDVPSIGLGIHFSWTAFFNSGRNAMSAFAARENQSLACRMSPVPK